VVEGGRAAHTKWRSSMTAAGNCGFAAGSVGSPRRQR
jgi:hypothetical protein